ncbi:MAG: ATP-binding protein [Salinispira sp.]
MNRLTDDEILLLLKGGESDRIEYKESFTGDVPFDICPVPSGKISDLSKSIFENDYLPAAFSPDVLKENNRSYEEQLSSCKMIVSPDNTTPTILGLLAIGKSPQDFIPGASIQFLRINGTELTDDIIDEEKIGGNIAEVLRRIIEKLTSHSRTAIDVTSAPTHNMKPTYPMTAIHQIVYNAVMHRTYEGTNAPIRAYWYNDRIEITSPGGPYGNVTPENFGEPGITDYRNPNIADVMKTYGFVQAFGRGIDIARAALEENGNPKPEFEVDKSIVMCIIRNKKKGET